ncbi:MAG TPA: PIN domain-containing protein [Candidatus Nanoarchaeia archaeon]|nr:PIN domain-containing protein [Candidatus Nanoarchaeia archaeon]
MNFIIDTNILLSALIKDSTTKKIIIESGLSFYYPQISFHEIQKYENLVLKKSKMNRKEYNLLLNILLDHIILVPKEQFIQHLRDADNLIGKIDVNDVVFLACAVALKSDIWSDDKHFKKQNRIKVYTTSEFVKRFFKKL